MVNRELSPRELHVLHLIAWGYTNKEIAQRFGLSVKTIEAHRANGMRKMRFSTRAELVHYAVRQGWLKVDLVRLPPSAQQSASMSA
jgi:two-component system response regulator NreC